MMASETLGFNIAGERSGRGVFGKVLQETKDKGLKEAKGESKLQGGSSLDDVLGVKPYQGDTKWVR